MSTEKTDALVIRQADFSETSRVVTFFTREFGKISAIAKGARRLKGPFEAALDLLTALRIVFIRKSSATLDILTEAQLVSRFKPRVGDLSALYGGYYVAELLAGLTEDSDPHPRLYDAAAATLAQLTRDEDPSSAIVRFELAVLHEIGQLPAFDACLVCGTPSESGTTFSFWVSQGGLICRECGKEEYHKQPISAGTIAVIRRLTGRYSPSGGRQAPEGASPGALSERVAPSADQWRDIHRIASAAITQILGRRPKMLRYLSF